MSFTSLEKAIKSYHQHMPATAGQPLVLSSLPVGEERNCRGKQHRREGGRKRVAAERRGCRGKGGGRGAEEGGREGSSCRLKRGGREEVE